ncbi:hypothetical protein HYALB_00010712 [Hymenoscyphus albidus]|uniref:Uncharacterized protein n=1 Tax=Hymenoscyphus albidus TaxID=595503 RepID=A0A9N9QE85_9HELO|nr:hypothetical protein HYALB_00010712 [Hymenoscyphus albidus]
MCFFIFITLLPQNPPEPPEPPGPLLTAVEMEITKHNGGPKEIKIKSSSHAPPNSGDGEIKRKGVSKITKKGNRAIVRRFSRVSRKEFCDALRNKVPHEDLTGDKRDVGLCA